MSEAREQTAGMVPAHDAAAEAAVLSACMLDPAAVAAVRDGLRPADFYIPANAVIYGTILELDAEGLAPDTVTIARRLRDRGLIDRAGGVRYLGRIVDATPAVAHVRDHAAIVSTLARQRAVQRVAHQIAASAYRPQADVAAWASEAISRLGAAAEVVTAAPAELSLITGPALAEPLPPLDFLVREIGLVAGGGAPHLVAGYGFSGKTLAWQSAALSLAAGVRVWGTYGCDPRRVVHVDLEQGERLTRRRYQRLAAAMGVDLAGLGDALAVAVMPPLALSAEHAGRWRELMTGRDLMIVDSLRAATPGAEENSSEIRGGLDMLGQLSDETGCRPVVIHHARKPSADGQGGRYAIRGSSAIYDGCDSVYLFAAAKGEPVEVEHAKARSAGELVDPIALVIEDVEVDGDPRGGLAVTMRGAELVHETRERAKQEQERAKAHRDAARVRTTLRQFPGGLGRNQLRDNAGMSGARLTAALDLMGAEVVREQGPGQLIIHRLAEVQP